MRPAPYSQAAGFLEGTGCILSFFGLAAVVGSFFSMLELGWVPAVYWGGGGAFGLAVVGSALFDVGYRWNRRCHKRWEEWKP